MSDDSFDKLEDRETLQCNMPSEQRCLLSIAISLKRIADKLELTSKQPIMMTADEALKYYKNRDGC